MRAMPPDESSPRESGSTVVVGAGLAGLNAAWRLHQSGHPVLVLEARDRVGGRTWSETLDDGTVIERGGEFIAPDQDVIRGLAGELGLELVPHGFSFDRRPTPRRVAPTDSELAAVTAWTGERAAAAAADASALDSLPPAAEWTAAETAALRRLETSLTVPLAELSARLTFTGESERYDPADRVRAGNQAIALELARRLGDRVRLDTPVVAVRNGKRGVTVIDADGRSHEAAVAVLALPLPLLLELDLEPGLPDAVRAVAARTRFGNAAKLHIRLAERPRPGRMAAADACWWCWTSQGPGDGTEAAPVLSCFAGGDRAVAAITVEAALALRPDVVPAQTEPLLTRWGEERWTRGSYSAPGVGLDADAAGTWEGPWDSVVFAGEHTAGARAATMNGAAASGARAAELVANLLRERLGD
ncbi:MAG: FAD-dependent oxidoreductase [Actinobacteria bacterium]|nr:FAD-dependent oxidoreductase [Actinomycetota bacterium]